MFVATTNQLKKYDQALLDSNYQIEELVDKASDCLLKHLRGYQKYVVVCGPGNNGADGISLSIKLFQEDKEVIMFIIGEFAKLSQANRYYLEKAKEIGLPAIFLDLEALERFEEYAKKADVVVDAIFGFGLKGELRGLVNEVVGIINGLYDCDIVAVDIPTGLIGDTGYPAKACVSATKTITLSALKLGFLNEDSKIFTGQVILESLNVPEIRLDLKMAQLVSPAWVKFHLKDRIFAGHKGTYGKILHLTGSDKYRGASLLAGKASIRTGSGIVTVGSVEAVINALAIGVPEAVSLNIADLDLLTVIDNYDACLIGCGLGLNKEAYKLVLDFLHNCRIAAVLDADALNIVADNLDLLKLYPGQLILTPHLGEFKRLIKTNRLTDLEDQAINFAREYKCILVLKGPNTLITDGEEVYRNTTGNKAMATGGMGDCLSGIIVSLLGQGYTAKNAAIVGVYLHGLAGDRVAKHAYTVTASDVIELIPRIMQEAKGER